MGYQTTIIIRNLTRERLKEIGKKGQTYDQLINQLLDSNNTDQGRRIVSF
jgi:hypothetical protein